MTTSVQVSRRNVEGAKRSLVHYAACSGQIECHFSLKNYLGVVGGQVKEVKADITLAPKIRSKPAAGFVGIFIPLFKGTQFEETQAASHSQEDLMTNLWSNAQLLEQVVLWTLR